MEGERIIKDFGSEPITSEHIERMAKLHLPIHRFLRR